MPSTALRQRIRELLEPTITRMGFDLVAVEWLSSGRPVLRLSIDGPKGVDLDDTARVNTRVSLLLDEADPIATPYELEVSSPGIDRPVQRFVDFERFAGFRAKLTLEEGLPRRRYTGTLKGVDAGEVLIEVDGVLHHLVFDQIEKAHLVLDLAEYARLAPVRERASSEPVDPAEDEVLDDSEESLEF